MTERNELSIHATTWMDLKDIGEKVNLNKSHALRFHLYRTLENANYSDTREWEEIGGGDGLQRNTRNFGGER